MLMRRLAVLPMLLAVLVSLGVAPEVQADEPRTRYVVLLKDWARPLGEVVERQTGRLRVEPSHVYRHAVRGYAAWLTVADARVLAANPTVAFVERDRRYSVATTQPAAPWGLDRIDQENLPLSKTFDYAATGAGVTAYVIDSGVSITHDEFNEGGVARATSGKDFVDPNTPATDCNGHGTHVAGTIGGETFGVAKGVTLVAVRVIDCWGYGWLSDIVGGVNWVTANHIEGEPAVANVSLGGPPSRTLNKAVRRSIADGVVYTLAAGNEAWSACNTSPAKVLPAITVSATNRQDVRPNWANFGSCVDMFAPGTWITSAWKTSNSASKAISGTSMAAPHVAGVAALYLEGDAAATPRQVRDEVYARTIKNSVVQARSANDHLLFTNGL
jgi:subtilisin family serine protease